MPLVAHSGLPSFEVLASEGLEVITPDQAARSSLPSLHIGLLNLMPDAALQATERQFLRLVAAYGSSADPFVYLFTVADEQRSEAARAHFRVHYETFETIKELDLSALIITGANPGCADITEELFWQPMIEVIDWGREAVHSVLCSCLATHAVLHHYHGVERALLPRRQWGLYSHELLVDDHPLLVGVNSPVYAPHSHIYDVTRHRMESAGLIVLAESNEAGAHMAVSADNISFVFFQGHPEYDAISLLKEFKREIRRFLAGDRPDYPRHPDHYFDTAVIDRLTAYKEQLTRAVGEQQQLPKFPEAEIAAKLENSWSEDGKMIYRNWLAEVSNAAL